MKIVKQGTRKFQTGGAMPAEQAAPESAPVQEQAEQDPIMMLAQAAAQAIQNQDCEVAMQVCQAFLEIVQQMQGGAPATAEPVYRAGGKLVRRISK